MPPKDIVKTLTQDKVTPGSIRFRDLSTTDHPLAVYLTKDEVAELGNPNAIKVTIAAA